MLLRARGSLFLCLAGIGAMLMCIGCQTPPQATTGDLVNHTNAAPDVGFPQPAPSLLAYRDAQDVAAMRRHGWQIWAAMTQLTRSGFPIFLTWYQASEVFGEGSVQARRLFAPEFRVPSQKTLGDSDAILSFNVYNAPLRDHVRQHSYQRKATLAALIGTATDVQPFPEAAMAVKTVWWPVRGDSFTALPVWDDQPTRPIEWGRGVQDRVKMGLFNHLSPVQQAELATHERDGNDFETFARVVAIDPGRTQIPRGETAEVFFFDPEDRSLESTVRRTARVVSLQQFLYVQINDSYTVDLIKSLPLTDQITSRFWKRPFRLGDYAVLVAAHVSTPEIPDWVWATFWWHDQPHEPPFGADRPKGIAGVFRHYRMHVAYSGDTPRQPDGSPHVMFNPYLEAVYSDGLRSNCVACHQRAVVGPAGNGPVLPIIRGQLSQQDPFFAGKVRLNFLWSLAFEAK